MKRLCLQEEGNSAGGYLAHLNRTLAQLQTEYNLLEQLTIDQNFDRVGRELAASEDGDNGMRGEILRGGELAADFQEARRRLLLLEARREQLLEHRRSEHPQVREAQGEIDRQRRLMDIIRTQGAEQFRSRQDAIAVQIRNVESQVAAWEEKALDLSRRMGEFERLQGTVERQKRLYERLLASVQSVDVNTNIQQDIVSIMEYATQPSIPLVNFVRELTTGALVGALAGFAILFIIGLLDDRIMSISELQTAVDEEVVGVIPKVPEGRSLLLTSAENGPSPELLEAFRNLRSWILLAPWEGPKPKTILITSAIPEEGKSTIASNLALTLAASGAKTLLVDADLHRGQIHKIFQVRQEPGLGEILGHALDPSKAICHSDEEHLDILPRGSHAGRRTDAFMSQTLDRFLEQVTPIYDYVVMDTCPALAVDDTTTLASKTDLALLVVRASFTGTRLMRKALGLLASRRARIEGIVFNCVPVTSSDYPYYRYYKEDPKHLQSGRA